MLSPPGGMRIWLVAGVTDMRRGFEGLSALVQTALNESPYSGQIFVFRGRRGDKIKILWDSQDGLCLFYKRLRGGGRFVWPRAESGAVCLSAAQLSMLLDNGARSIIELMGIICNGQLRPPGRMFLAVTPRG